MGIGRGNAHDLTANQKVRFRVKAVGLDFELISRWLVQDEQRKAIAVLIEVIEQSNNLTPESIQIATNFVKEFRKRLEDSKTDRLLVRLINEHL